MCPPRFNTHHESLPQPPLQTPTPDPSPREGRMKPLPQPLSQGEGSKMQIDLANALVCKAYFVYYVLFIISPQARPPLLWRGRGRLSPLPREGLGVGFSPSFGGGWGEAFGMGVRGSPSSPSSLHRVRGIQSARLGQEFHAWCAGNFRFHRWV